MAFLYTWIFKLSTLTLVSRFAGPQSTFGKQMRRFVLNSALIRVTLLTQDGVFMVASTNLETGFMIRAISRIKPSGVFKSLMIKVLPASKLSFLDITGLGPLTSMVGSHRLCSIALENWLTNLVMATLGAKVDDSIIQGGKVAHVGQIYFDQTLHDAVHQQWPYSANNQIRLRNKDDIPLLFDSVGSADPVAQYIMLGEDLKDGVFAWINFAIDATKDKEIYALAECDKEGCKQRKQWWVYEVVLRILTISNVYWKKPPLIPAKEDDVKVKVQIPSKEEL